MTLESGSGRPEGRESRPLKLRARDIGDLHTIAAVLQDALVPLADIAYLKPEKRFLMVANRFRWETGAEPDARAAAAASAQAALEGDAPFEEAEGVEPEGTAAYERVNCGVCFDRVVNVRVRGLDLRRRDEILNLLTLEPKPTEIGLIFSGATEIRLEVKEIRCHLEDLGEPWPTLWRPSHLE
ncbi:MAG: DUF2948 family protein [Kiloniellales bacterium]